MPSFRFQWVSSARPNAVSARFALARPPVRVHGEPVVVARHLDASRPKVLHRLVGPSVPELHLGRAPAEREPQQLVAEADAEHGQASQQAAGRGDAVGRRGGVARPVRQERAVEPADLARPACAPGPRSPRSRSPRAAAGSRASSRSRRRRRGAPGRGPASPARRAPGPRRARAVETPPARSAPSIPRVARTRSRSDAGSGSSVDSPHRIAPRSRSRSVSRRVSIPSSPTTPSRASSSASVPAARQLDARREASRTTNPATWTRPDSGSSGFVPVLPWWGAVIVTTCPAYEGSVRTSW